jgi:hypothetical protein
MIGPILRFAKLLLSNGVTTNDVLFSEKLPRNTQLQPNGLFIGQVLNSVMDSFFIKPCLYIAAFYTWQHLIWPHLVDEELNVSVTQPVNFLSFGRGSFAQSQAVEASDDAVRIASWGFIGFSGSIACFGLLAATHVMVRACISPDVLCFMIDMITDFAFASQS